VIAAVALLAFALVAPITMMRGKSATFDEVTHLPAGYTYLTTGRIELNKQHPPLIKQLCAIPLLAMDLRSVDRPTLTALASTPGGEWSFGRAFLYSQNADRILF
jgi:hypothetical protein